MKRSRVVIAFIAAVVVGCLVFAITRPREPRYQGRTLTQWIGDVLWSENNDHDPKWEAAEHAVKHMAPEAVPWLLKLLQAKDSSLKEKVAGWLNDFVHLHMRRDYEDVLTAKQGFALLGEDAKQAWPEMIRLTQSADSSMRSRGLLGLSLTKLDKRTFIPILLRGLKDPDPGNRYGAAMFFIANYPQEAEAAGAYKNFPQLKGALTDHSTNN